MLVLKRSLGQKVVLTADKSQPITITIVVKRTGPDWCSIGFDAPKDVRILRAELLKGGVE